MALLNLLLQWMNVYYLTLYNAYKNRAIQLCWLAISHCYKSLR